MDKKTQRTNRSRQPSPSSAGGDERSFTVLSAIDALIDASEHPYRVMVEAMNEGAVALSGDGVILYSNRAFARLVNGPLERVIGARIADFVVPTDADKLQSLLLAAQSASQRMEVSLAGPKDLPVPALVSAHPLNPQGPAAMCAVVTDLADVVATRDARLAALVESSDDAIMAVSLVGLITTWNAGAERLYGYTAGEAVGHPLSMIIPTEHAHEFEEILRALRRQELMRDVEMVLVGKDGTRVDVSLTLSPLKGRAMEGDGASIIARDVTQARRDADQLRLHGQVFETSNQAIFITDDERRIVAANGAFAAITGQVGDDILGTLPSILRSERHDAAFYADLWRTVLEHGHWQGEIWDQRKSGDPYPTQLTVGVLKNPRGEPSHYIGAFTDIGEQKAAHERIEYLAHNDPLTGLPNRSQLQALLAAAIENALQSRTKVAVLFLDIDRFKEINDSLGHPAGDQMLVEFAGRLRASLRSRDTVIRLGGDEFLVLLVGIKDDKDVATVAGNIAKAAAIPYEIAGHSIVQTLSIGISIYPENGGDAGTLVRNADTAMYSAKKSGRNASHFYSAAMDRHASVKLSMESNLRKALERGEFCLHYQPQMDLISGEIVGAEALIRWDHPEQGLVPPLEFIPFAEERGLIIPIGEWAVQEAFSQNRSWQAAGFPAFAVAVNLSPLQFQQNDFVRKMQRLADNSGLSPHHAEFEITEGVVMRDVQAAREILRGLKSAGFQISIDDFGTGYSSLNYLKRFPIDRLKIDQSFVRGLPEDLNDAAIVNAILAMARALQLTVVAEGVETQKQALFLRASGCTQAQGYLYSRPLPAAQFTALLSRAQFDARE